MPAGDYYPTRAESGADQAWIAQHAREHLPSCDAERGVVKGYRNWVETPALVLILGAGCGQPGYGPLGGRGGTAPRKSQDIRVSWVREATP